MSKHIAEIKTSQKSMDRFVERNTEKVPGDILKFPLDDMADVEEKLLDANFRSQLECRHFRYS